MEEAARLVERFQPQVEWLAANLFWLGPLIVTAFVLRMLASSRAAARRRRARAAYRLEGYISRTAVPGLSRMRNRQQARQSTEQGT